MKHCHFSIIYNELPFLKQKLPFLYEHFHQIIFYDLNIKTFEFSNDGSHEFIKNYPDPQNKITLIEKTNLDDVTDFKGHSFVEKQKMFAVGSKHVKNDIDVFWCTDADEFFDHKFFTEVDRIYKHKNGSLITPQVIYVKDKNHAFCDSRSNVHLSLAARITKHQHGNIYGHCSLHEQFLPVNNLDIVLHHFAYIGERRVREKVELWKDIVPQMHNFYNNVWKNFKSPGKKIIKNAHPVVQSWGIKHVDVALPSYIDYDKMIAELG